MKEITIEMKSIFDKLDIEREAKENGMTMNQYILFLIQKGKEKIFQEAYEKALKAIDEEFGKQEPGGIVVRYNPDIMKYEITEE